jgi:hypothetical protein
MDLVATTRPARTRRTRAEHLAAEKIRGAKIRAERSISHGLPKALQADIRRRAEALGLPAHRLVAALLRSALTVCL